MNPHDIFIWTADLCGSVAIVAATGGFVWCIYNMFRGS
jgi:hypothetical protein